MRRFLTCGAGNATGVAVFRAIRLNGFEWFRGILENVYRAAHAQQLKCLGNGTFRPVNPMPASEAVRLVFKLFHLRQSYNTTLSRRSELNRNLVSVVI